MSGIREAALTKKEETRHNPIGFKTEQQSIDFTDIDDLDETGFPRHATSSTRYSSHKKDTITITLCFQRETIGDIANYYSDHYNNSLSETRAVELAYDKLETLLGKHYESRYTVSFNVEENVDDYEVTVTLTD